MRYLIPLALLSAMSACALAPMESTPVSTQHTEKVNVLNDKIEVMDFLNRLKAAFDEDLGLKPDVFLKKMNIEYDKSSLIRLRDGSLVTSDVKGIKTGVKVIDDMPKESVLGRPGSGVRYSSVHGQPGMTRYEFEFRIPDEICLDVKDVEYVMGKLKLYAKDRRMWLDSNGQPSKLEPREFWDVRSVVRHPVFREQYWMFFFSYENEKNPRPKCLEIMRVIYSNRSIDPAARHFRLLEN